MTRRRLNPAALFVFTSLSLLIGLVVIRSTGDGVNVKIDDAISRVSMSLPSLRSDNADSVVKTSPVVAGNWPPVKGQSYPDLILNDQNGQLVRLSEFKGRPILLELAAIPCAGCQAFAGANDVGSFAGAPSQANLDSIHKSAERFANVRLGKDKNVVFVQLLLYGNSMSSPTSDEVAGWAKHFGMDRSDCNLVLQADASMLNHAVYHSIPGFHLIDSDFTLKYDSTGHHLKDDLYRDLLPALGEMARERPSSATPITPGQMQSNPFGA